MSENVNGHNVIGQVSPSGHQMTVVVLHMATPADWNKPNLGQTGKDKFVKAIEKAMNAHSRVETGPGGAVLMGMFVRTDAPGDAGVIDKMRTEYPLADLDMDLLEAAYGLLCAVSKEDADSYSPGWGAAFEVFKAKYHERLEQHVSGATPKAGSPEGDRELERHVFEAIGAASTCWESLEGTGVFQSDRAKQIGESLLAFIHNHYKLPQPE